MSDEQAQRPLLRVVRGNPDDAELAALTTLVAGLASADGQPPEQPPRSHWASRASLVRQPPHPGPGAWKASALPH